MILGRHSYFLGTDHGVDTVVGNFSSIAGGTYIHGPDNHAVRYNKNLVSTFDMGIFGANFTPSGLSDGPVVIGNDVWIGEFAQIMSGVKISDGAIIGAHTVVGKDVPPYAVVVGNPYQIKRFRFSAENIQKLLNLKWWNWSDDLIKERLGDFVDIGKFIKKYGQET